MEYEVIRDAVVIHGGGLSVSVEGEEVVMRDDGHRIAYRLSPDAANALGIRLQQLAGTASRPAILRAAGWGREGPLPGC